MKEQKRGAGTLKGPLSPALRRYCLAISETNGELSSGRSRYTLYVSRWSSLPLESWWLPKAKAGGCAPCRGLQADLRTNRLGLLYVLVWMQTIAIRSIVALTLSWRLDHAVVLAILLEACRVTAPHVVKRLY